MLKLTWITLLAVVLALSNRVLAFAPSVHGSSLTKSPMGASSSTTTLHAAMPSLQAAAVANPFKKLPWNVRKERERERRRMKQESAKLHRQLGIPEDATYEEIVAATDSLLAKANGDIKQEIQIEVAKDKILQMRLNERLAGLAEESKEARAASRAEMDVDDDDLLPKQKAKEWNAPRWMQGLVVKPDEAYLKSQIRLWGIITGVGLVFPPAQDYLGRFTWLVCVAQLTFRGMPREETEAGGLGISFSSGGGGGHRKVAFALGFGVWVLGSTLVYTLLPSWARGQRWTGSLAFSLQNMIFCIASCYLQPYKG